MYYICIYIGYTINLVPGGSPYSYERLRTELKGLICLVFRYGKIERDIVRYRNIEINR